MVKETRLRKGVDPNIQDVPAFTTKYLDYEKEETDRYRDKISKKIIEQMELIHERRERMNRRLR